VRRGKEHGFEVVVASVDVARDHIDKPERPFFLDVSRFTGCVKVTNAETLAHALTDAIGGGRAFGCGMLQLLKRSA
jgi:CRISPR system Cascade subunit CasE